MGREDWGGGVGEGVGEGGGVGDKWRLPNEKVLVAILRRNPKRPLVL